jgi:hypothetical protein
MLWDGAQTHQPNSKSLPPSAVSGQSINASAGGTAPTPIESSGTTVFPEGLSGAQTENTKIATTPDVAENSPPRSHVRNVSWTFCVIHVLTVAHLVRQANDPVRMKLLKLY